MLDRRAQRWKGAEDAGRAAFARERVVERAVRRERDLAAVAGEDRAAVGEVGRGDGQTETGRELRAAALRLQHVRRISLFADRFVGRRGDEDDVVAVGIADRVA